jgi:hypothetical protein
MANTKNKYLIYGDDEREQLEDLDSLSKDLDEAVHRETLNALKKRSKNKQKAKPKANPTEIFTPAISEELTDLPLSDEDSVIGGAMSNEDAAQNTAEERVIPEEEQEEAAPAPEPVEEPVKKPKKGAKILLITLLIIFLGLIGATAYLYYFKGLTIPGLPAASGSTAAATVEATAEATDVPTPTPTDAVVITNGRLPVLSGASDATLNDSLVYATTINGTVTSYYDDILNVLKKYQDDPTMDIESELYRYRQMISLDCSAITSYQAVYRTYGGDDYYTSAADRFSNLQHMVEAVKNGTDTSTLYTTLNNYIRNENTLSEKSRKALIDYLDSNNVEYTADDNTKIVYDELSVASADPSASADASAEASAGAEITESAQPEATATAAAQ